MGDLKYLDGREYLIKRLDRLLNLAREGKIKGIAYALVNDDNSITTGWRLNNQVDSAFIAAGASDLHYRLDYERYGGIEEE